MPDVFSEGDLSGKLLSPEVRTALGSLPGASFSKYEPQREKTNNVDSDQV